jgi:thiol:disulfide interchange protein
VARLKPTTTANFAQHYKLKNNNHNSATMISSRWFTLLLVLIANDEVQSFQTSPVTARSTRTFATVASYANSAIEDHRHPAAPASSFQDRMRRMVEQRQVKPKPRPNSLIKEVVTLEEFKQTVVDDAEDMVVVRFYAPWCRACKAMAPGYLKLAKVHPNIQFVQVPVTETNMNLHQGLGVPSTPYVHLYHPEGGLIEEQKLTRKHLGGFHKLLEDYETGSCSLERKEVWSSNSPYVFADAAQKEEEEHAELGSRL